MIPALWVAMAMLAAGTDETAAQEAVAAKRFSEAREIYRSLLEREPANDDHRMWIARLSSWMGDPAEAEAQYDIVLSHDALNADAMIGKAFVLIGRRRLDEASALLERAESLAPDNSDIQVARGSLERARNAPVETRKTRSVELQLGYQFDHFSFTSPGNMGSVTAAYVGELGRMAVHYEAWDRFGERTSRGGVSAMRRVGRRWYLRGGTMQAAQNSILARNEFSGGVSRALPRGLSAGVDYRLLRFAEARVNAISPSLEYYFRQPIWLQVVLNRTWTSFRQTPGLDAADFSFVAQYHQQVTSFARIRAGYARGNESYAGVSIDRLGRFEANTWIAGGDFKLSPSFSVGPFCAFQYRSNDRRQQTFGFNLTVRR